MYNETSHNQIKFSTDDYLQIYKTEREGDIERKKRGREREKKRERKREGKRERKRYGEKEIWRERGRERD